ncbi:multifunctional 2',3'-cyclic-nucleotide 2'-phosphodiesterase/5'-nucleotidase/3'-nucleotidase [Fulvitalea axinellae]|uniref:Multifunctional 2',3'-cyclic-nucleotide 2'-phosphodiesterase/5'-nucleotidase/3'-nucleotidase n=1 Tax=Fulvitalea axinellae TaxID=1182444 RepID=A0AAU9CHJ5_9BACT|nr:multifunctional 2',3'-cyclic-nucleotide 2'-phosphodiesterase/5'-nucleotidase/3'-nucleotidase [Fulvitalea axinellae]
MKKGWRKLLAGLALATGLFSCAGERGFTGEVVILHTNDMHAKIARLPRVAYMVDSIRNVHENVVLVSAGDLFSGYVTVDQYPDRGYPMVHMMNNLKYDISALGNHEFDYGQVKLNERMKQAKFPFVCANVSSAGGILEIPAPYKILELPQGPKIAFLGLLESFVDNIPSTHPKRVEGLKFPNPYETAKKYTPLKDSADLFVALSHLGDEPDSVLAEGMPELDAIVGGHSHVLIPGGKKVNGVLITQAHSMLKYVGELVATFENGKLVSLTERSLPVGKGAVDPVMEELLKQYESDPYFKTVIGKTEYGFDGQAPLGNLMADALADQDGIDIAVQNYGGVRLDKLPKGDIKIRDIFALDPFGNQLTMVPMTAKDIKTLLFYGSGKLKRHLFVSGIKYDILRNAGGEVTGINIYDKAGKPLDEKKTFTVGMSDYVYSAFSFDRSGDGTPAGLTTAEAIIEFVKAKKNLSDYSNVKRIK